MKRMLPFLCFRHLILPAVLSAYKSHLYVPSRTTLPNCRLLIFQNYKNLWFLMLHRILFFSNIKDPSCPYIFCKTSFFKKINPYLKFMIEGFWWGFIAICIKKNVKIYQIKINHKKRVSGKTNVFLLNKIPSIALRNILGLIKLRFISINY